MDPVIRREAEEGIGPGVGGRSNLEGEEMRRRGRSGQEGEEKRRRKMKRAQCVRRRGSCMHEG